MGSEVHRRTDKAVYLIFLCSLFAAFLSLCGCTGYSGKTLYVEGVNSVYVEMFDNQSFRRNVEYKLTDALSKRIETQTPYKIISSKDRADTVISGRIVSVEAPILTIERETGRALERQVHLQAVFSWKNLRTGEFLVENQSAKASASYSQWQQQGFEYGSALAANNLAVKIVELMEKQW